MPISEGLEHPDLPDGTGEFLDSWLMLLEKMVNPKTVLESPHSLPLKTVTPTPNYQPFDAIKYLINTQRRAFECVMHLWNKKPLKTYGERMSETVLTILCHLLKGEVIIQEKLARAKELEAAVTPATGQAASIGAAGRPTRRNELEEQGINSDHLQQLQDMGFARELALEALLQTATLEQATDYLLSHPGPMRPAASVRLRFGVERDHNACVCRALTGRCQKKTKWCVRSQCHLAKTSKKKNRSRWTRQRNSNHSPKV